MNEIIRKRKSVRKYDMTPLDTATLETILTKIDSLVPLYPDIRYSIEITNKTKGLFNVKAPHYLVFGSEEKDGTYENIGFIGQQLDLFFSELGIGSCWLGAAKPTENEESTLPFVICMSFGNPAEPVYRAVSDFKRKKLADISIGEDSRIEAARLAPSGLNRQNWYFVAENGVIHCYRKKLTILTGLWFDKMEAIDLGIAIYHLAAESENFNFVKQADAPVQKGYIYAGTVK